MLKRYDFGILIPIVILQVLSFVILKSVAPSIYPSYFWYIALAVFFLILFSLFDFEVISCFSKYFYIGSIVLLLINILIGQVTRGTVRWIPIGSISIQPSEIVKPFLLVFFANFLTEKKIDTKRLLQALALLAIPLILILIQPSLGVSVLLAIGFLGIFFASDFKKINLLYILLIGLALIPVVWFLMAPYQKQRINTFLNPSIDPLGAGYNSIQSMISVGSGKLTGRGLGRGVGTQLYFLPERHTDFIFASIAEEMGFVGTMSLMVTTFILFWRIISFTEKATSPAARAFLSGLFLNLFAQVVVHVGMNMGLFPITGVPYPLVSAGGSSLLATMISLGIVLGTKRS